MMRRSLLALTVAATGGGDRKSFLEKFRDRLAADPKNASLESFLTPGAAANGCGSNSVSISAAMSLSESLTAEEIRRGVTGLPSWLKMKVPKGHKAHPKYNRIRNSMRKNKLSTVCEEAKCPNIGECWGGMPADGTGEEDGTATATIMMMGSVCTRGCRFCSVATSRTPPPLDPEEPANIGKAVADMGVEYIVLTMVDRDDVPDGGAAHVAKTIQEIKARKPEMLVEALVGDFAGVGLEGKMKVKDETEEQKQARRAARMKCVEIVANSGLEVYAHNIECVERITPHVRDPRATYRNTLETLAHAKQCNPKVLTKSSIMLGLGESQEEVYQCMKDLRDHGVSCLTLGQYLQPSLTRLKVSRYVHPDEFTMWQAIATKEFGFDYCASGPLVRSSYRAGEFYITNIIKQRKGLASL